MQGWILGENDDETCYGVGTRTFCRKLDGKLILNSGCRNGGDDPCAACTRIDVVRKQHDERSLIEGHVQRRGDGERLARE